MTFPPMSAFEGAQKAFTSCAEPTTTKEAGHRRQERSPTLHQLNRDYQRLPDTLIYDYPKLVRDNTKPFADLNESEKQARVAVIGSGFAGLTAAYELKRAGLKPVIYEARSKPGGRADSRQFRDASGRVYTNEMGPMRMPDYSKLFWHYLYELSSPEERDKPVERFPNPGVVATQLLFQGDSVEWAGDDVPQGEKFQFERIGKDFSEKLIAKLNFLGLKISDVTKILRKPYIEPAELQKVRAYWFHFVQLFEDKSLRQVIREYIPEWGPKEFTMFGTLGLGTGGFGPLFPVCFLEVLRLLIWDYQVEHTTNLSMSTIIDRFLEAIFGCNPTSEDGGSAPGYRNETVTYVGVSAEDPNIVNVYSLKPAQDGNQENGNELCVEQYDYVVVATTLRSMQIRMNLDSVSTPKECSQSLPLFAGDSNSHRFLRAAIRKPNIMDSSKLFGFLPKKPWTDPEIDWPHCDNEPVKCILTDTLARQMYFLDPFPDEADAGLNVLISYNWGTDSGQIQGVMNYAPSQVHDPRSNADFILKTAYQLGLASTQPQNPAAQALGQIRLEDQDKYLESVIWQNEPMIFGAFKLDFPSQYVYVSQLVFQYQNAKRRLADEQTPRVYLAGNNCSFLGGWIEGAMMSGVNAASAVLRHLVQDKSNFRMEELFADNPFQEIVNELEWKYQPEVTRD